MSPKPFIEIDERRAVDLLCRLLRVSGPSGSEEQIMALLKQEIATSGVAAGCVCSDNAHGRIPSGGSVGNLIVKIRGGSMEHRRMLIAHTDTVPDCVNCEPLVTGSWIRSTNPNAGLGADNRCGVAVLLTVIQELSTRKLDHPPLTFLFSVQEELGQLGVRYGDIELLGTPIFRSILTEDGPTN